MYVKVFLLLFGILLGRPLVAQMAPALRVTPDGRSLVDRAGRPVFLLCDTAWNLANNLGPDSVEYYLERRRRQGFNALTLQAFPASVRANAQGHWAFAVADDRYDPLRPLTTPGEYDHWDHLDYIIDRAAEKGMYVLLLPTWGTWITGGAKGIDTTRVLFNPTNAYAYGRWLGNRYRTRSHLIWMLGGDQSAVYPARDFRPVVRAMAEGLADGVTGDNRPDGRADWSRTLMSYHPEKLAPQSADWFHPDDWLDFNSIQDWPDRQLTHLRRDWGLTPPKPTWLFEGRYEAYHRAPYRAEQWRDWQVRFQAYQTVLAGAFGHTYGHEYVFKFLGAWAGYLDAPGGRQMAYLMKLMQSVPPEAYLSRVPDDSLLASPPGEAGRMTSDFQQALRSRDGRFAMIYTASARPIEVRMARLRGPLRGYWYNPRTGQWHHPRGTADHPVPHTSRVVGRGTQTFTPPGAPGPEQDWVLVLRP